MKKYKEIHKNNLKRTNFNFRDPFLIEEQYSSEEIMVRNTARNFAEKELLPKIVDANRHEKYDKDIFLKFGKMGRKKDYLCF